MDSGVEGKRQQFSTRIAFLIAGIGFSTLAPFVPDIKSRLGLDDGRLGLLLLCVGLGSMLFMPFAGGLTTRFGCRKVITLSSIGLCASLPIIVLAPTFGAEAFALLLMGAAGGTLDVSMNIQAVIVEEESGRPMMSGFHGMFSVGGIVGAGGLSLLMSLGTPSLISQAIMTGVCLLLLVLGYPHFLSRGRESEDSRFFALPRGAAILLGVLCLIVFMAEGSVTDWSGILLKTYRHVEPSRAGLGYVAFAAMMTVNRLFGDIVVAKLGRRTVVLGGCLCAAIGFFAAAWVPASLAALAGFAMVGIGLANAVPIFFTAAGRQSDMPPNLALASVTSMGYVGLLGGPPALGFIAKQSSLLVSLSFLSVLCVFVGFAGWRATRD